MGTTLRRITLITLSLVLAGAVRADEAANDVVQLPAPRMEGGKPLMQALKERQTLRDFSAEKLSDQTLSDLLWAAWGVNRPDSGKRTAPSARNRQEVDVYVVTADGAYLYRAEENRLVCLATGDLRAQTGAGESMAVAPVQLLFVADYLKSAGGSEEDKLRYAAVTVGCIVQNVYLYCASEGLATVTRASNVDPSLIEALKLGSEKRVLMAQTVGYPAKKD